MTQESQQTANSGTPPVPQFNFTPGPSKSGNSGKENSESSDGTQPKKPKASGTPAKRKPKQQATEAEEARKKFKPKSYKGLSSKARKSIQSALAELSHIRSKTTESHSIKYFIGQALTEWNESPRSRLTFVPKEGEILQPTEEDLRLTFNNEIEENLKDDLSDLCHERGKVGHPIRTLITILDDAFCQWLPKQEDLPQEYLDAVLQVSQKTESVVE